MYIQMQSYYKKTDMRALSLCFFSKEPYDKYGFR